jgi:hypothetical protein
MSDSTCAVEIRRWLAIHRGVGRPSAPRMLNAPQRAAHRLSKADFADVSRGVIAGMETDTALQSATALPATAEWMARGSAFAPEEIVSLPPRW